MKITHILLTATTVSVIAVGVLFKFGLDEIREQAKKEREFEAWKKAELYSIQRAQDIVTNKIMNGDYDGMSLGEILSDMEFYRIASLEEKK